MRRIARDLTVLLLTVAAAGIAVALTTQPAHAYTRIVTNTRDTGPGTLLQAVLDAIPGNTVVFNVAARLYMPIINR